MFCNILVYINIDFIFFPCRENNHICLFSYVKRKLRTFNEGKHIRDENETE